jgi:hypothetical protein
LKLKEFFIKVLIRIWTYLLKTKRCNMCVAKNLVHSKKRFFDKCVNWKKIKAQLKVIELIFIILEYHNGISFEAEVCVKKYEFMIEII